MNRLLLCLGLASAVLLAGCEKPPMESTQTAFRGLAMGAVINPRVNAPVQEAQVLPAAIPAIPSAPGGPLAKDVFKNVKVLGDVPVGEFTRTMLAITAWVSPKEGCNYCHKAGEDLALDTLYTKVVARKMLEMTRHVNSSYKDHVKDTGVTCWTCHRGQAVPAQIWFDQPAHRAAGGATAENDGHNHPNTVTGLTAIDNNVLVRYLLNDQPIRAGGTTALPIREKKAQAAGIMQTENTFGLMIHMSQSLGVNCTHCHNTRSHTEWAESPPTRVQAYHGILMSRDINKAYMVPLTDTFPANRKGAKGDVAKVSCATCHQGVAKPLNGAPLLKDHDVLAGAPAAAATAAVAVPAAATAPVALSTGKLGSVFFTTGKEALDPAGLKTVADAAAAWKTAGGKGSLTLSGFADQKGNAAANMDLARKRAFAVRDALQRAGVPEASIQLKKPETAVGGDGSESRRVDILAGS